MKKPLRVYFVLALLLSVFSPLRAQYTFEMMDGRLLEVYSYNDTDYVDIKYRFDKRSLKNAQIREYNENLRYELADEREGEMSRSELDSLVEAKKKELKEPKVKEAFIDPDEIFAIHKPGGEKEVLYEFNETIGNYYTQNEMQEFIIGERDAILRFKGNRAFWGGVAFGAAGGFAWQNSVFAVTTPLVWTGIVAIPVIRIKEKYMSDPSLQTEPYRAGFARTARTKNILQGLKGSVIGTVAGVLIYSIVANNSPNIR